MDFCDKMARMGTSFNTYLLALLLSTAAGFATLLGGLVAFVTKKNSMKALAVGLGFSAGVMIFISLTELIPSSHEMILETFGAKSGWITLLSFMTGISIAILIDYLIPDHIQNEEKLDGQDSDEHTHNPYFKTPEQIQKIKRAGLTTAIAVTVHNFPEGLATFFATTASLKLGLSVFLAIAIHNIPEGIAISVPIYHATNSKRKALGFCLLSGLAEPLGGVLGFLLLHFFFPQVSIALIFAFIAGIMTYISFDTILPLAREYDTAHYSITGVVFGMIIMGIAVLVF